MSVVRIRSPTTRTGNWFPRGTQLAPAATGFHSFSAFCALASALLHVRGMATGRIDFISAYCDRWCERCAFTDRCSGFACNAAIAMCGDAEDGIELAVGRPRTPGADQDDREFELPDFLNQTPSDEEMAEFSRLVDARRKRIEATPLSRMTWTFTRLSHNGFDDTKSSIAIPIRWSAKRLRSPVGTRR